MNVTDYLQTWAASYKEDFVNNISIIKMEGSIPALIVTVV